MDPLLAIAIAALLVWLGMVLAISFLEAPLKFTAPGVTLPIGLGIGRLVFRALNACEAALGLVAAGCLAAVVARVDARGALIAAACAIALLVAQLVAVRPFLAKRSNAVLAGDVDGPRSHAHLAYVALEIAKVAALVVAAVLAFGAA